MVAVRARCTMYIHTLFVSFGTICKEVFASKVDAVTVKVVRLKEPCPEFFLGHLVRHVLIVLLPHCVQHKQHNSVKTRRLHTGLQDQLPRQLQASTQTHLYDVTYKQLVISTTREFHSKWVGEWLHQCAHTHANDTITHVHTHTPV